MKIEVTVRNGRYAIGHTLPDNLLETFSELQNIFDTFDAAVTVNYQVSAKTARDKDFLYKGKVYTTAGNFEPRIPIPHINLYAHSSIKGYSFNAIMAHEFGHLHHYLSNKWDFRFATFTEREYYANQFVEKYFGLSVYKEEEYYLLLDKKYRR